MLGALHEWMDTWKGEPAAKPGTKQQTVGRPEDPWPWVNSESTVTAASQLALSNSRGECCRLTSIVDHMTGHLELANRHLAVPREEQDVPVAVTHLEMGEAVRSLELVVTVQESRKTVMHLRRRISSLERIKNVGAIVIRSVPAAAVVAIQGASILACGLKEH